MGDYISAWQCIGCGRLEAHGDCVGICQDRKVRLVHASDHEALQAEVEQARRRSAALEAVVRQIASVTPRGGEWERTYKALQESARRALAAAPGVAAPADPPPEAAGVTTRCC